MFIIIHIPDSFNIKIDKSISKLLKFYLKSNVVALFNEVERRMTRRAALGGGNTYEQATNRCTAALFDFHSLSLQKQFEKTKNNFKKKKRFVN
jgi:hypothetical protein